MNIIIIVIFLLIKISSSDNVDELLKPRYDGNNIYYSMIINMKGYIENDYNLDKREIYENADDLIGKKIGAIIGSNYNETKFTNVTIYNNSYLLLEDLTKHKIDGAILDGGSGKYLQAFSNDIDIFDDELGRYLIAFGFQKNDDKYTNEFNNFLIDFRSNIGTRWNDYGYDDESSELDLEDKNGTINVTFRLDVPPYAYKLNEDAYGTEILLVYAWAQRSGYAINFIEAQSFHEEVELLKNKSCNVAGGIFPMLNEYRKDIGYSNVFRPSSHKMAIRYENTLSANDSNKIFSTISDFDGESLGSLMDNYYQNLTKTNFPNSKITAIESFYDIYTSLLIDDISGCLLDKPLVDYFVNRYPDTITVYPEDFDVNNYGFGFQKNTEGEKLMKEFNEFLNKTDIDALYYKWTHTNTKGLHVDTNLNTSGKMLNVAINMDFIPLCFYNLEEPKGYEFELIYLFAKEYNYQINFTKLENDSQRMTYLTEGKAEITGGHFTITEGRKESIHFSEPILKTSTVFTVRTDSKKEYLTTIVVNENYEEKPNNNIDFKAIFSNATKNASCILPKQFNDSIIVNCTIYNVTDIDPYNQGFEYGDSTDKIKFVYYSFNASNLYKANELIPGENIVTESNKTKSILSKDDEDQLNNFRFRKNSNKSLSAGGIVAIVIPSVGALAVIVGLIIKFGGASAPTISNSSDGMNSEIKNIKI